MQRHTRDRAQIIARARTGESSSDTNLVHLLQTEEIPYWRAVAANLLGGWAAETNVAAALLNGLNDTNALVRSACVRSLAPLVEAEPVSAALQKKLSDPLRNVRVAAAWALRATLDTNSPAGKDMQRYLEVNADQPTGQLQLGDLELSRGNVTNALHYFQTAAKWDPFSPGIRHETAIVLSQLGRSREAVAELQEAVRLAPRDAEFRFKLALAWNELGETTNVLAELEAAVKLDPHHARAAYNLGLARNAAGDPAGAIQALLTAEAAQPNDPAIPYARATILAQLGRINDALTAAQHALDLNPNFTQAAALIQQLQQK